MPEPVTSPGLPAPAASAAGVELPSAPARGSLARGGALVAPALMLVNVVGYVLAVAGSRALDPDGYGQLTALLGVLLLASVPALGVQAVAARAVARRPAGEPRGVRERGLLVRSAVGGAAVALVVVVLSPVVAAFLHVGVAGPLWVAAGLLPLTVLAGAMGVLQGSERFGALALVICAQALGKLVGLAPLLVDGSAADVLAALAAGTLVAALLALLLVGLGTGGPTPAGLPTAREATTATAGLFALLVLANLDVLLARHLLDGDASGRYSVGAVCAKAAFWLPQVVAVVVFPRLSEPAAGRVLLRKAVLVVTALSLVELAGALTLARPVLELTFGEPYGATAPLVPLFVVQGATLAVVQLLVYRAIATRDAVPARVVGAAAMVEAAVLLLVRPTSPGAVVAVAAAVAVALAATLLLRAART